MAILPAFVHIESEMFMAIGSHVRPALVMLLLFTLLLGIIYPFAITGVAQGFFPHQANSSIITVHGQPVGSTLIGQPFSEPRYFWGRLSATEPVPYNGAASSGSNLAPTSAELLAQVEARVAVLQASRNFLDAGAMTPIPVDLVTASGSGLDPHISLAGAYYQIPRVAQARDMDPDQITALVNMYTEGRSFGFLGEPRVNVLKLNLALDGLQFRE